MSELLYRHSAQRLRGLDALRGLAALAVVLYHYTTSYESHFGPYAQPPLLRFPNGHFGVELFFCISGFVILGTLERTVGLKRFSCARFARMYPAYLVCAALALMTRQIADLHFPTLNAPAIAMNAAMLSSFSGTPTIDPSYWTLTYEVLFYAGAGLAWALGRRRHLEWLCLAWLAACVVGHLYPWVGLHHRLSVLLDVQYANLFIAGMMLYRLSRGTGARLALPTLGAALAMTLFLPESNVGHLPQLAYMAMIACFCAAIWIIADTDGEFLDIKPLVFLGEISYSLYLIHQVVGFAIIRLLLHLGVGTNVAILFTICLMVVSAYFLRIFVEKPAERWIKGSMDTHSPKTTRPDLAVAHAQMRG